MTSWPTGGHLKGLLGSNNQFIMTSYNPLPHTTILQQMTFNIISQKKENLYNWMNKLWLKVENIVTKGEIARFEQLLLLSLCSQKAVFFAPLRCFKALHNLLKFHMEGKGWPFSTGQTRFTSKMTCKNIVAEEEFVHKEPFLLLPQCFRSY